MEAVSLCDGWAAVLWIDGEVRFLDAPALVCVDVDGEQVWYPLVDNGPGGLRPANDIGEAQYVGLAGPNQHDDDDVDEWTDLAERVLKLGKRRARDEQDEDEDDERPRGRRRG